MKYILVQWSSGNIKSSILTENYVRDRSMLFDHTKEGIISFATVRQGDNSVVRNKGKLGRVACVSEDRKLVEEHQNLLLAEDFAEENELIEDEIIETAPMLKRPRNENINGQHRPSNINNVVLDTGLQETILQMMNQTLKKQLPELLCNAINSSKVIQELRTCPTCKKFGCNGTITPVNMTTIPSEPPVTTTTISTPEKNIVEVETTPVSLLNITSEENSFETSENFELVTSTPSRSTPLNTMPVPKTTSIMPKTMSIVPAVATMVNVHSQFEHDSSPDQLSTPVNNLTLTSPGTLSHSGNILHKLSPPVLMGREASTSQTKTPSNLIDINSIDVSYAVTYRKMTLALLSHLFDKETLKVSSVTGSGKEGRNSRQPLDKDIVQYIIDKVQKRFPEVKTRAIKAAMAQKCKYLRQPPKKKRASETSEVVKSDEED